MRDNLEKALIEALNDEYKARATYSAVISKFGAIRPFTNIVESEERHIQALLSLFRKYEIPIPVDNWADIVKAPASVLEACQTGVSGEIENREMYQKLLAITPEYPDVQRVFLNLQRASQENHLPAFQRCAERSGSITPMNPGSREQGAGRRGRRRNHSGCNGRKHY
ncbi:MAG: DUF2202 domain-containing protein [Cyanobacteriota bacterium]|nr:DUF2202 domain-containing protein [Cyanobacteriota bacterium]